MLGFLFPKKPKGPAPQDESMALMDALVGLRATRGENTGISTMLRVFWLAHIWHVEACGYPFAHERFEAYPSGPIAPYVLGLLRTENGKDGVFLASRGREKALDAIQAKWALWVDARMRTQSDDVWKRAVNHGDNIVAILRRSYGSFAPLPVEVAGMAARSIDSYLLKCQKEICPPPFKKRP